MTCGRFSGVSCSGVTPHPFQLPIDGVQSHRICGVAEFFRGGSGGHVIFTLRQRPCQHIGYKQVRVAQLQDMVADGPIAAVTKVDAQQTDELAMVLDEKGAGAEILSVDVDAVIVEMIVHTLIALVPENTQGHIGQRRTELSAADVTVGDGDDGTVLVGQVMQRNFIIRAKSKA